MLILGFIIGTVLGSFIKAAADRIIKERSLLGRSYCLGCKQILKWYDLFPVFSYLFLKGRCRYCHKKIGTENFLAEIFLGLLVVILFYFAFPTNLTPYFIGEFIFKLFIFVVFAIVFIVDLKTGLIHDRITYPTTAIALVFLIILGIVRSLEFYLALSSSPLGQYLLPPYSSYFYDHLLRIWSTILWAVISGFLVAAIFYLLIIVTRGKGMGGGDVKYALFLGLALGFPNIIVGIFLAFLLGAIISLILILVGKKHFGQTVPFGPFLSLGAFIALILGDEIINWYLQGFR